ncbi:MAG: 50S ribosomal protein L29 [Candidatus Omnitrophica bacterium]|nr:50S ribosomal protein L29 [Candidatus Omnitrophota bacterium]
MTKASELRPLTANDLKEKIHLLEKELFEIRGKAEQGAVEKPSRLRAARKEIARMLTILKEKELGSSKKS